MAGSLGNNGGRVYSYGAQPVLIDCSFTVDATNGLGVTGVKGQGVENVFMHTSTTPTRGPNGLLNPNPASGYAWVQLSANYNRFLGSFNSIQAPVTGSGIAIDSITAGLTAGTPYQITSVGHAVAGQATIAPVADSAGSLASTWFRLYDAYGNTWIIWFSVSGVGVKPSLGTAAADGAVGLHYVQQSILSGATAAQIGTALVLTIQALPSGISGVYSFTASGTTTVTVVNTNTNPYNLPGAPADGTTATGFTFALTVNDINLADWQGVGLPKGLVPTVGQSFVATATGFGSSTGQVKALGVSGISAVEVLGNPSVSFAPQAQGGSPYVGGWVLVKFLGSSFTAGAYTPAGAISRGNIPVATGTAGDAVTNNAGVLNSTGGQDLTVDLQTFTGTASSLTGTVTTAAAAPTAGSVVYLGFYVDARLSPSNVSSH